MFLALLGIHQKVVINGKPLPWGLSLRITRIKVFDFIIIERAHAIENRRVLLRLIIFAYMSI